MYVKEQQAFGDWDREIAEFAESARNVSRGGYEFAVGRGRHGEAAQRGHYSTSFLLKWSRDVSRGEGSSSRWLPPCLRRTPVRGCRRFMICARDWDSKLKDHTVVYQAIKTKLAAQEKQLTQIEETVRNGIEKVERSPVCEPAEIGRTRRSREATLQAGSRRGMGSAGISRPRRFN